MVSIQKRPVHNVVITDLFITDHGHNRPWSQQTVVTTDRGHNRPWSQQTVVTTYHGHNRPWSQQTMVITDPFVTDHVHNILRS